MCTWTNVAPSELLVETKIYWCTSGVLILSSAWLNVPAAADIAEHPISNKRITDFEFHTAQRHLGHLLLAVARVHGDRSYGITGICVSKKKNTVLR